MSGLLYYPRMQSMIAGTRSMAIQSEDWSAVTVSFFPSPAFPYKQPTESFCYWRVWGIERDTWHVCFDINATRGIISAIEFNGKFAAPDLVTPSKQAPQKLGIPILNLESWNQFSDQPIGSLGSSIVDVKFDARFRFSGDSIELPLSGKAAAEHVWLNDQLALAFDAKGELCAVRFEQLSSDDIEKFRAICADK